MYSWSPIMSQILLKNSFGILVFQIFAEIEMTQNENETENVFWYFFFAWIWLFLIYKYIV